MATNSLIQLTGSIVVPSLGTGICFPGGLSIELLTQTTSPPGWLGSASLDSSGNFTLYTSLNPGSTGGVICNIYRHAELVWQGMGDLNNNVVLVLMEEADYISLSQQDEDCCCFRITGALTLGEKNVVGVPQQVGQVTVNLRKSVFRNNVIIAQAALDRYGRFCFSVPCSLIKNAGSPPITSSPVGGCNFEKSPSVYLTLEIDGVQILKSELFLLSDEPVVKNLHINDNSYFHFFFPEYYVGMQEVAVITGLPPDQYGSITEDELINIINTSLLQQDILANIVLAAQLNQELDINPAQVYAFVRYGFNAIGAITNLELDADLASIISSAIADYIIGPGDGDLSETTKKLNDTGTERYGSEATDDSDSLKTILLAVINDDGVITDFLRVARSYAAGDEESFWTAVTAKVGSSNADILRIGLQVLGITGLQPDITKAIMALSAANDIPEEITSYSEAEWNNLVTTICNSTSKLCVPKSIRGDETDPHNAAIIALYASKLYQLSNKLYNSRATKSKIANDPDFALQFQNPGGVTDFLNRTKGYDFRNDNAWQLEDINDDVKMDLLPVQNLIRLTDGNMNIMGDLLKGGIRSSSDIAKMEEADFLVQFFDKGSEQLTLTGKNIYAKARSFDLLSKNYYVQLLPNLYIDQVTKKVNPRIWIDEKVIPSPPSGPMTTPDLQSLFGSMDFCSCSDCTSMYSPAAYYTDLLNFIKTRVGTLAYNELIRRRPDLVNIDLSCKNSNTALPYIDLVVEQLELLVLNSMHNSGEGGVTFVPQSFQTSSSASELDAFPEHVYKTVTSAYDNYAEYSKVYDIKLKQAFYPNSLPFDLALEESRVFFKHLGYSRYALMETFQPLNDPDIDAPGSLNTYINIIEYFGITKMAADIICNQAGFELEAYYGQDGQGSLWYEDLCNDITTLLSKTNITYKELLQLLVTDFLNKETGDPLQRPIAIVAKPGYPVDTCIVEELMLEFRPDQVSLKINFFDRLHRFIRLYKAGNLTIYQLDIILTSFGATDITVQDFMNTGYAIQLAEQLRVGPEAVVSLWSDIDTHHYINFDDNSQPEMPSEYDKLFRNKAIINPVNPNFNDPSQILGTLGGNTGTIIAAFGITENDFLKMINGEVGDPTTIDTLSAKINAYSITYKGLGFNSFEDFYNILLMTGIPVYTPNPFVMIAKWQKVLEDIGTVRGLAFTTDELSYLIRNIDSSNQLLPTPENIQRFFEGLRLNLRNVYKELTPPPDPNPNDELLRKIATEQLAANFNEDAGLVGYLIGTLISEQGSEEPLPLLDYLTNAAFIKSQNDITPVNYPGLHKAYIQLQKCLLITSKLKISKEELTAFQDKRDYLRTPDFRNLPTPIPLHPENDQLPFAYLIFLNNWIVLRDKLLLKADDLIRLILVSTGGNKAGWIQVVQELTQWDNDIIIYLAGDDNGTGILNVHFDVNPGSSDLAYARLPLQMADIMAKCSKLGIKANAIYPALLPSVVMDVARTIRMAAKAKYDIDGWLKAVKPLQDTLRKKQRNALADYIIAHPEIVSGNNMIWENENDLFAYLLVDVEMEACMKTSRLRLGMSTLQLYIDRIILNLERVNGSSTVITMSDPLSKQWQTWRKWYRVWEANRKIFMYPENWIEPELRDDKTPLFKELETFLLQDAATDDRLEEGFRIYLEGLDEIARLEPVSVYHDTDNGNDILHVFGRTSANPHVYYYRTRTANQWSPWEKIPIDIKSDHVAPYVWNNKLYIFWLTFQSKVASEQTPPGVYPASGGGSRWIDAIVPYYNQFTGRPVNAEGVQLDITLNWSLRQNGKWLNHEMCKDVMNIDISKVRINKAAYDSYSDTAKMNEYFIMQAKRGELKIEDLFKNRLYMLITKDNLNWYGGGLMFSMSFAGGINEDAAALHWFIWYGDSSRDPQVMRNNDAGYCVVAPASTSINNMKFEQDNRDGKLYLSQSAYSLTGYYVYSYDYYWLSDPGNPTLSRKLIIKTGNNTPILNKSPYKPYKVTARAIDKLPTPQDPAAVLNPTEERYFYEDGTNTYFVEKSSARVSIDISAILNRQSIGATLDVVRTEYGRADLNRDNPFDGSTLLSVYSSQPASNFPTDGYRFYTFYHAQIINLFHALNSSGIDGLLSLSNQTTPDTMNFSGNYQPTAMVATPYPDNKMQFSFSDPYGIYNWELFFHIPMIVAQGLSTNQQFQDAQKWYHYIFDPTSNSGINTIQRYWKFYPFYVESGQPAQTLAELIIAINQNNSEYVQQVRIWEDNPFNPHIIARMRILAYMKNVLMKYLDNLIAWGDNLFRMDTIESINEATQLYILASNILGERPREIPPRVKRRNYTFLELIQNGPLDALSNAMVVIESFFAPNDAPADSIFQGNGTNTSDPGRGKVPPEGINLETLYFCLPKNDKLLAYWDTISDRLFKIRNCMNIDGQTRQLALYEPPIDPALLVRAMAMGIDIGTVLSDLTGAGTPRYRFTILVQKANEIISDVKALGNAILSAIEKKDAETLALLRSTNEIRLLEKIRSVKEMQVSEAEAALDAVQKTKEVTQLRFNYYSSRPFKNANEDQHLQKMQNAMVLQVVQGVLQTVAGVVSAIPTAHAQAVASGVSFGGLQLSNVLQAASTAVGIKVAVDNIQGSMAATTGGYERRMDDWKFQAASASKELEQIEQQLLGAQIRLEIANKELANQDLQIENATEADDFMHSKFSNAELYGWMQGQIATSYFQSYQLAYEMAKKAETCYDYELPAAIPDKPATGFIKYGYWDSLRKGLLAGENLQFDLRKMESSYMDENKRHHELTKSISLAIWAPEKLMDLKATGTCSFDIPEILYDLDYPGHYMRRIKSVSISIPCVAGPYTTISCELSINTGAAASKYRKTEIVFNGDYNDNENFSFVDGIQTIATSTAQNDSGIFELNFRDERYLPFEGMGAISNWTIAFPETYRQFDYETITDVILHIKYTALSGGGTEPDDQEQGSGLKGAAIDNIREAFRSISDGNTPLYRYFSLKHEFSNEWYAYQSALENEVPGAALKIKLDPDRFPFFCRERKITAKGWYLQMSPKIKELSAEITATDIGISTPLTLSGNEGASVNNLSFEIGEGLDIEMTIHVLDDNKLSDISDFYFVSKYILEDNQP